MRKKNKEDEEEQEEEDKEEYEEEEEGQLWLEINLQYEVHTSEFVCMDVFDCRSLLVTRLYTAL